jgi:hypothetical protein
MGFRIAQQKVRARRAHIEAVEQRGDVIRLGVAAASIQTVRNRAEANTATALTLVDAALHLGASRFNHRSSSNQGTSRHAGGVALSRLSNHVAGQRRDEQCAGPNRRPEQDHEGDPDGRRKLQEISRAHVRHRFSLRAAA